MGWETFRFGQLTLDGERQSTTDIPQYQEGQSIDIVKEQDGDSVVWVKPDGMNLFVADRVLLGATSWRDLNEEGFVKGRTVLIDGCLYRCRLLQVGDSENESNEWDKILDKTTDKDDIWHWRDMSFWGIGTTRTEDRVYRGYYSARSWYSSLEYLRNPNIGFRPVLEPLFFEAAEGTTITLDGQNFVLSQLQGSKTSVFYPQLTPTWADAFMDIPDGNTVNMYTAFANGKPVRMDLEAPVPMPRGEQITITDEFCGEEYLIPWVVSNGVAIASRPVARDVF